VISTREPLHLVCSNAGIFSAEPGEARGASPKLLEDGTFEQHYCVNFFSMVLLVRGLQQLLESSSSTTGQPSRVVVTGSFTTWSMVKGQVDFGNLQGETGDTSCGQGANSRMYAQSKLLQHMWCKQLGQNAGSKLIVVVFDPGIYIDDLM
jgi:NAD(P)-dependent dehydrogenase (short-subunit alcohol dehydrogenase family)